ncbi:MAG: hypothetical protein ACTSQ4_01710, partial [Candidatus Heimdallarchaeaceae archaeon]
SKRVGVVLLSFVFLLALVPVMTQAKNPLYCTMYYEFVGHHGIFDDEGRILAWQGTVSGDINGEIEWYMFILDKNCPQVTHFANDRWYIFDSDTGDLLLKGDEKGTTTIRHGKNSVWRANGIVLEANEDLAIWLGRHVHMTGHFEWIDVNIGFPGAGTGILRIN